MKVTICDRCKRRIFTGIDDYFAASILIREPDRGEMIDSYDLCDICVREFEKWLKDKDE